VLAFILRGSTSEASLTRLQSSNGRAVTTIFAELQGLAVLADLFERLVLDAEVVAFDGKTELQHPAKHARVADHIVAARRSATRPVMFELFDLLRLDGHDTMARPLTSRRGLFGQISDDDPCWAICEQYDDNVDRLLQAVID
jgi:ATP-dependent DNA ligase